MVLESAREVAAGGEDPVAAPQPRLRLQRRARARPARAARAARARRARRARPAPALPAAAQCWYLQVSLYLSVLDKKIFKRFLFFGLDK